MTLPDTPVPSAPSRVAIVGGGIMGISLAYFLAERGIAADIYEASPVVGGLAGPMTLADGTEVDRFYHAILSSDSHLRGICRRLGLDDALRFATTRSAFFVNGGVYSMNSLVEFLTFAPLSPLGRLRLGLTVALAQWVRDVDALDRTEISAWLRRLGGHEVFERLWSPMLHAKFDGPPTGVRATWMWSRLVRMKSTREGANQREQSGHLVGGYKTLLTAMVGAIERAGGRLHLRAPVTRVAIDDGRVAGVVVDGELRPADRVVVTMQGPIAARLLGEAPRAFVDRLEAIRYLGIVCPLLVLNRRLSGTWVVNIADRSVPLTGIIETTSYIDPTFVGGHHLVYLPKYTAPGSAAFTMDDDEVRRTWIEAVTRVFPSFSTSHVVEFRVHRERFVEPLHPVGAPPMPGIETPVDGLYLATTAQIYPALTNGESVTRHAAEAASLVARSLDPAP